jgi:type I restriction enzyme S subunit
MSETLEQSDLGKDYKEIHLGPKTVRIPPDWELISLGNEEYAERTMGGTPDTGVNEYWGGSIPWMRSGELHKKRIQDVEERITEEGKKDSRAELIPEHSILVGLNGQGKTKGTVAINEIELTTNQSVGAYLINHKKLDYRYVFYSLESQYEVFRALAGGGRSGLNLQLLGQMKIPYPPISEQRRIADILSTVDEQIQQTDHIITDLRELRRGLRQDMYRAGLTDASLVEHPTMGEYPENWSVAELSAVAEVTMGSSPKSEYYNEEGDGLPFFQGSADFGEQTPTVTTWCSKPNKTASRGDILMSVRAPVGDLNIATEECCIGRGLAGISPIDVDLSYLYGMLKVRKEYLASIASGSTFESINSSELRTLDILVPQTQEQEETIGEVLESVTKSYEKEKKHKQHLEELKRGLMQDLLTGEVRVNTD